MTTLGREIKKARAGRGLKQKDLRTLTGITQKYLSRIENDQADPSFSLVLRIVHALEMEMDLRGCEVPAHQREGGGTIGHGDDV